VSPVCTTLDMQYESPFLQMGSGLGEGIGWLGSGGGYSLNQPVWHGVAKELMPVHGQSSPLATHSCRPPCSFPWSSKFGTQHFFMV
jgi:hypothetical protein